MIAFAGSAKLEDGKRRTPVRLFFVAREYWQQVPLSFDLNCFTLVRLELVRQSAP
jgi:hypothetical protein